MLAAEEELTTLMQTVMFVKSKKVRLQQLFHENKET